MKKLKYTFVLLLLLIMCSCGNDDEPDVIDNPSTSDYTALGTITGMDFFDENGQPIGRWGFPNHNPGEIFPFPIPNTGITFVASQETISRVWLLPAECFKDSITMDITMLSQDLTYEVSELEALQIRDIPIDNFNNILTLDFEDVPTGFYRLFFQVDTGELFWYNMYIDPSVNNFPDFDFMENMCE